MKEKAGGKLVIEVDASVEDGKYGLAGCGWVILAGEPFTRRDFVTGQIVQYETHQTVEVGSKNIGISGINKAELHAVLLGLRAAAKFSRKEAFVVTDSKKACRIINAENCIHDEEIMDLVLQINAMQTIIPFQVVHVEREDVALAHQAANSARQEPLVAQNVSQFIRSTRA